MEIPRKFTLASILSLKGEEVRSLLPFLGEKVRMRGTVSATRTHPN